MPTCQRRRNQRTRRRERRRRRRNVIRRHLREAEISLGLEEQQTSSQCDIWINRMSTIHLRYRAMSSATEAETEKGRLRRLACNIERKEKGGRKADIGAVCDPGAMASLLSKKRADELNCHQREANGIVITTANGAALDVRGQSEIWLNTKSGKRRLVHVYICTDLSQDMLVSADDCEALGLLPRHWPSGPTMTRCRTARCTARGTWPTMW